MADSVSKTNACRMKASMKPGVIAIILAGRYAGKRVVVLKPLRDGYVAVTGPYEINKVPMIRCHQKMLMGTSSSLDLSGMDLSGLDYKAFCFPMQKRRHHNRDITEQPKKQKRTRSAEQMELQNKINNDVRERMKKADPLMKEYLASRFSLFKTFHVPLHELKF